MKALDIITELNGLIEGVDDFITNASNFSSLIFHRFENLNWVGFYMLQGRELMLGPFQGKPACIKIPYGKGICGASVIKRETIIADDVHLFEEHIACDSASNSEIVIPMIILGKLYGVLDIDSPLKSRFSQSDALLFERMLNLLINNSDMDKIYEYYNK